MAIARSHIRHGLERFQIPWNQKAALGLHFIAFSSREPVSTSLENALGTVRPYLHGFLDLAEFVRAVFDADALERVEAGRSAFHIEARIGDSIVVLETGNPPHPSATPASISVYVADVDATYRQALEFGAKPIAPPEDKPYQERACGVADSFGNIWWIATFKA